MKFNGVMEDYKYPKQVNTKVEKEIKDMVYDLKKIKSRHEIGSLQRKALTDAIRKEWNKHFKKSAS